MTQPNRPLDSDSTHRKSFEGQNACETAHKRLHEQGYSLTEARSIKPQRGENHEHNLSIVDRHGHPVERIHHVRKGETLHSIARDELKRNHEHPNRERIGKLERRIIHANDLKQPYHLKAGDDLLIPKLRHRNSAHGSEHKSGRDPENKHPRDHSSDGSRDHKHDRERKLHHQNPPRDESKRRHHQDTEPDGAQRHLHPGKQDDGVHRRRTVEKSGPPPGKHRLPGDSQSSGVVPRRQETEPRRQESEPRRQETEPRRQEAEPRRQETEPRRDASDAGSERNKILAGKTVFIDVGHGGQDTGAVAKDGTREKDITGQYAAQLKQKLEAAGVKVVLSRPIEDDPSLKGGEAELKRREKAADQANADVIIRIHANSAGNGESPVQGLEAWWDQPKDKALTTALHDSIVEGNKSNGLQDHGIKQKSEHYKFQPQKPSALLELGYITNPQERAHLKDPRYRNSMTDSIVQGLVNYFKTQR